MSQTRMPSTHDVCIKSFIVITACVKFVRTDTSFLHNAPFPSINDVYILPFSITFIFLYYHLVFLIFFITLYSILFLMIRKFFIQIQTAFGIIFIFLTGQCVAISRTLFWISNLQLHSKNSLVKS